MRIKEITIEEFNLLLNFKFQLNTHSKNKNVQGWKCCRLTYRERVQGVSFLSARTTRCWYLAWIQWTTIFSLNWLPIYSLIKRLIQQYPISMHKSHQGVAYAFHGKRRWGHLNLITYEQLIQFAYENFVIISNFLAVQGLDKIMRRKF